MASCIICTIVYILHNDYFKHKEFHVSIAKHLKFRDKEEKSVSLSLRDPYC